MNLNYWIYVFTGFYGRINREPFWIAFGILVLVEIASQLLSTQLDSNALGAILDLAVTYPEFAVAVKRSNDRNLSPWFVAVFFAVAVAADLFTLINGPIDSESTLVYLVQIPLLVMELALIVELGFRPGTPGPNRFGPDPLSRQA
jgi:uncharacterized membrane protein YhaH (DUF805 family)